MSKTTENDLYVNKGFNQERYDNFSLGKHLVSLMWEEPFYTRVLRSLTKIESNLISTAGVSVKDGDFKMIWNRKFMSSLNDSQIKGLLKHECLHLVYEHVTSRKKDPHIIWNYATDLAINCTIPLMELPKGGLNPGYAFEKLTEEETSNMTEDQVERYYRISNLIKSLPSQKTSEYYYDALSKDEELKEDIIKMNSDCCGEYKIGFDDHEEWDNLTDEEREMVKLKFDEIIKDAIEEANNKGWGTVPSHLIQSLSKLYSKQIKWSDLLKRFCGFSRTDDRTSSIRRLNRKYPGIHPGSKKNYKPKIAVYIDESGSMHNDDLCKLYAELDNLSKTNDFYVYKFDAKVDESSSFLWKKGSRVEFQRNLTGGTCFNSVTNHALKNKSKFDAYVIMTDGCASKPKPSNGLRRAWIIIPNYTIPFDADSKDVVIQMK